MQGAPYKICEVPEHSSAYLIYLCGYSVFVSHLACSGPLVSIRSSNLPVRVLHLEYAE